MLVAALLPLSSLQAAGDQPAPTPSPVQPLPDWAYPIPPPPTAPAPPPDARTLQHLPGSRVTYTQAQLTDLFGAPDWHPESHSPMPPIVANGRKPDVGACGFCHLPGGQGRPENAALAGLPASYIAAQVAAMASGERSSPFQGGYKPTELMIGIARHATADEVAAAADYFSRQPLPQRVRVLERARVPRSHVAAWMHVADAGGGDEPLGQRLLEFAPDLRRHEQRDEHLLYIAYVPPGSIARGKAIAHVGGREPGTACETCHGPALRGLGLAPPLAGRTPGYLLRQLLSFQAGTRHAPAALPMRAVALELALPEMIDAVAYAASLPP